MRSLNKIGVGLNIDYQSLKHGKWYKLTTTYSESKYWLFRCYKPSENDFGKIYHMKDCYCVKDNIISRYSSGNGEYHSLIGIGNVKCINKIRFKDVRKVLGDRI